MIAFDLALGSWGVMMKTCHRKSSNRETTPFWLGGKTPLWLEQQDQSRKVLVGFTLPYKHCSHGSQRKFSGFAGVHVAQFLLNYVSRPCLLIRFCV